MKRLVILLPLLAGLAMPISATHSTFSSSACEVTELPWATVQAVLKKVTDVRDYSYSVLEGWYHVGRVTITQSGSSYQVTINADGGLTEVLVIDNL